MCHFKLLILTLCVEQGIYNYVRKKFLIGIFLFITTFGLKFLDMNKGYLKLNVLFVVFLFAFFLNKSIILCPKLWNGNTWLSSILFVSLIFTFISFPCCRLLFVRLNQGWGRKIDPNCSLGWYRYSRLALVRKMSMFLVV